MGFVNGYGEGIIGGGYLEVHKRVNKDGKNQGTRNRCFCLHQGT